MGLFDDEKVVLGIDPGVTGAVAVLHEGTVVSLHDIPTMALGKGSKQQINPAAFARLLESCGSVKMCYLEQVNSFPGQGVASSFNFGVSYGIIQGTVAALEIPMVLIHPVKWKRQAGLIGANKDAARALAARLYPSVDLSLKKYIGRADAILIARYGEAIERAQD